MCLQTSPAESVGTHVSLRKIAANDLSLRVGNDVVTPMDTVRNLRVILHSELTMQRHVNKVASACFYYIHRVKQIRWLLGPEATATLISAFVLSRLDYCNALLAGLPKVTIAPLQRAQNAAARHRGMLKNNKVLQLYDHVTTALCQLHWLPVQYRITYKLCLLMHLIHIHKAPSYFKDTVTPTASVSSRGRIWSATDCQQFQLRAATDETQTWSALFLICCTSHLEHSTAITATTH